MSRLRPLYTEALDRKIYNNVVFHTVPRHIERGELKLINIKHSFKLSNYKTICIVK